VRFVVLALEEVRVVGGHHRQPDLVRELEDALVELVLPIGVVSLHLQVVAPLEKLRVPGSRFAGLVPPVRHQVLRHLTRKTGAGHDQSFGVPGKNFAVDAGLGVEPFGIADGGKLAQVFVTLEVTGEQNQVVVPLFALGFAALEPAAGRDVRFHPDDRLDARLLSLLLKSPRAKHAAVVRQG